MPEVTLGLFPMIIVAHLVAGAAPQGVARDGASPGARSTPRRRTGSGSSTGCTTDRAALSAGLDDYAERVRRAPAPPRSGSAGGRSACSPTCRPARRWTPPQFLNLPFFLGADLAEGATAFLEKRPPRWVHPEGT